MKTGCFLKIYLENFYREVDFAEKIQIRNASLQRNRKKYLLPSFLNLRNILNY